MLNQPAFGPAGDWFIIRMIEPKALLYYSELMDSLLAQQYVLEGRLQSGLRSDAQASLDRWKDYSSQNAGSPTTAEAVENLVKRAEQTSGSKRRDQLLYRAAQAAVRAQEYDRALQITEKLSLEYQKEARDSLILDIALSAVNGSCAGLRPF